VSQIRIASRSFSGRRVSHITEEFPTVVGAGLIKRIAARLQRSWRNMDTEESVLLPTDGGTLENKPAPLPPALVETMKLVFRETHGGEMTPEDREFLGIADQ
jgi:hypothetical protein